jgi:hypothetical protein
MEFDPVFGLTPSARLADTGSLACIDRPNPDTTDGLYVQIAGVVGDATNGIADALLTQQPRNGGYCGQSLRRTTTGVLFAAPEGGEGIDPNSGFWVTSTQSVGAAGDTMPIPGSGTFGDSGSLAGVERVRDDQFINPFDCEAWCLFTVHEAKIIGSRVGGTDEAFAVIGRTFIDSISGDVLGSDLLGGNHRFDYFGSWVGADPDFESLQHASDIHALFRIEEGGTVTVRTRMLINRTRNFDMTGGGEDGGVAILQPAAMFWRRDSHPVGTA